MPRFLARVYTLQVEFEVEAQDEGEAYRLALADPVAEELHNPASGEAGAVLSVELLTEDEADDG